MTDARFPEKWLSDRRLSRLAPEHFRSFAYALIWSVSNRTDGRIEPEDLALIPHFTRASVKVLVAARLWTEVPNGWLITDFAVTQTSRSELEVLENVRAAEARKKRRQRAAKAAGRANVPGDSTGGQSPGTAQDRTGQARPGQEQTNGEPETSWRADLSAADLDLCPDCREHPPVGAAARTGDDPLRCRRCNDDLRADAAADASSAAGQWPSWRGQGPSPFEEYQ